VDGECAYETVAERALIATWVNDEFRLAVQKGYEIVYIMEVYEYHIKQYDPQKCQGGLFVKYIDTLLKLKTEVSRYPA